MSRAMVGDLCFLSKWVEDAFTGILHFIICVLHEGRAYMTRDLAIKLDGPLPIPERETDENHANVRKYYLNIVLIISSQYFGDFTLGGDIVSRDYPTTCH